MDLLAAITWDVKPEIFPLGFVTVRWYGLFFALAFLIGQWIFFKIFKAEDKPEQDVETLTIYMVLATIIGARLGHCLFYQPEIYLSNPIQILKIWEGGLASHGGAVGIFTALYIYVNYNIKGTFFLGVIPYKFDVKKEKRPGQSYLWLLDRMAIVVALGGFFIRMGNLMNSEIVGVETDMPWGFIFTRLGDGIVRHPAQLYESLSCLVLFFLLLNTWNKKKAQLQEGLMLGIFLIWVFGLRFLYEFIKVNQVRFEDDLTLNMGQILSIPLVLAGIYLISRAKKATTKKDTITS
ncbi:prolipoprotein diacylglyceryl transferase [Flammeovirgaceae bacterium SG7u.111]|nr:prolipoprotein diacylglyceryl transferase [Flammeovirgaceae bacterium SG7u.132]WPO36141.1 prolipoprotein diacylglyceryl transferase [Flammeovirgaceae bacterium SG7u.111]